MFSLPGRGFHQRVTLISSVPMTLDDVIVHVRQFIIALVSVDGCSSIFFPVEHYGAISNLPYSSAGPMFPCMHILCSNDSLTRPYIIPLFHTLRTGLRSTMVYFHDTNLLGALNKIISDFLNDHCILHRA